MLTFCSKGRLKKHLKHFLPWNFLIQILQVLEAPQQTIFKLVTPHEPLKIFVKVLIMELWWGLGAKQEGVLKICERWIGVLVFFFFSALPCSPTFRLQGRDCRLFKIVSRPRGCSYWVSSYHLIVKLRWKVSVFFPKMFWLDW